jgi:hypothetical protein
MTVEPTPRTSDWYKNARPDRTYLAETIAGKNQAPLCNKLVSSASAFRLWTTFPIPTLQSFYVNPKLGSRFSDRKHRAHGEHYESFLRILVRS